MKYSPDFEESGRLVVEEVPENGTFRIRDDERQGTSFEVNPKPYRAFIAAAAAYEFDVDVLWPKRGRWVRGSQHTSATEEAVEVKLEKGIFYTRNSLEPEIVCGWGLESWFNFVHDARRGAFIPRPSGQDAQNVAGAVVHMSE